MMKKLARLTIFTLLLAATLNIPWLQSFSAVNGNPSSGTVTAGQTVNISLTSTQTAVSAAIHVDITGGTIIGYTAPNIGGLLQVADGCAPNNSADFTSTQLCVAIAGTGNFSGGFPSGTNLGTVQILIGNSGSTVLTKNSNTQYSAYITPLIDPDNPPDLVITANTGTLATFNIGSVTTLPATGIFDDGILSTQSLIYIGSFCLTTGVFLLGRKYYLLD